MWKSIAVAFAFLAVSTAAASAQNYPDRSIKVVVPYPAGGPTDTIARAVTQSVAGALGQSIVIENQAGAGGRIALKQVANAAPDGYTLLMGGTNNNAVTPAVYKDLDFDAVHDFAPVASVAIDLLGVVVHPSVPVKTLKELAAYAKANPGKLTSGGGVGIAPHFLLEFVRVKSGANIVFVPYKGAAPALTDAIAGQIQMHSTAKSVLLPQVQSGKLRALAVTRLQRSSLFPELPTMDEAGVTGFDMDSWAAIVAPAGVPPEIVTRLNTELRKIIDSPEVKKTLGHVGFEAFSSTPGELGDTIKVQLNKWGKMVKDAGIQPE